MKRRVLAIAACLGVSVHVTPLLGQSTVMTRPLSASVQGTFISAGRQIEILILWRGAPGWFFTPERSRGGGNGTAVSGTLEFGPVRLEYSYDRSQRVLRIGDRVIPLPPGENVVLVDEVERSGGRVVKTLTMDFRLDSPNPSVASILSRSKDVIAFLKCELPGPDSRVQPKLNAMACDELR